MKTIRKLLIPINIILTLVVVACVICAMIFNEARLALLIITLLSFLVLVAFNAFCFYFIKQNKTEQIEKIMEGIEQYQNNQKLIIKNGDDEELNRIANAISTLSIEGQTIYNKHIYDMKDFIFYVDKHIDYQQVNRLAYLRMSNVTDISSILDAYDTVYINKEVDGVSLIIVNYANNKNVESTARKFAKEDNQISLIFYPDYSLSDFTRLDKLTPTIKEEHLQIFDKKNNPYRLNNFYSLVRKVTLKDDKSDIDPGEFILQAMRYLPFSNIVLEVNGQKEYFKWSDQADYAEHKLEEYDYMKELLLYQRDGNQLVVHLASYNPLDNLSNEQELVIDSFLNTLLIIYLPKFLNILDKEAERRIAKTMINNRGYNYAIDKNHNIVSASKNLSEKFKGDIIGKKCYKVLFDRNEPCKYCPRMGKPVDRTVTKLGTNTYNFHSVENGSESQISLIENAHEILNREALQEALLDQINNEKHGYIMVFKVDFLTDLSLKHKVDKSIIIDELVNVLEAYSLNGALFRKEEDEFAYLLENTRYAECVDIAKKLSLAFEDKIVLNDNGVALTPKIILLSYPLEVNSLFALDSLSRTLFKMADKRGKLYRLAIDPVYVNRKREYLEIIEKSLKDDKIPVAYEDIIDTKGKDQLVDVHYHYVDKDNNDIREDTFTLYAKLEGFYFPVLERVFKSVQFEEGKEYVFYFGREAIDNSLFATIVNGLNAMKIPLNKIIIISEELYFMRNKELIKKYGDMGMQFALSNIEGNSPYELPVKVRYARVNKEKFMENKPYALKVMALANMGIPFICNDDIDGIDVRYRESIVHK